MFMAHHLPGPVLCKGYVDGEWFGSRSPCPLNFRLFLDTLQDAENNLLISTLTWGDRIGWK